MKQNIIEFYLEFLNNWLTVARYAEANEISERDCANLLRMGRQFHNENTQ